jgi:hypothetical protein
VLAKLRRKWFVRPVLTHEAPFCESRPARWAEALPIVALERPYLARKSPFARLGPCTPTPPAQPPVCPIPWRRPATNDPRQDWWRRVSPATQIWATCAGYFGGMVWKAPAPPAEGLGWCVMRSGRTRGPGVPSGTLPSTPAPAWGPRARSQEKACFVRYYATEIPSARGCRAPGLPRHEKFDNRAGEGKGAGVPFTV